MIARVWSARTAESQLQPYLNHLTGNVVPQLRALDGFAGFTVFTRRTGGEIEVVVTTMWESLEKLAAFAGDDLEAAIVPPEAAALLSDYDRRVRHYDVVLAA